MQVWRVAVSSITSHRLELTGDESLPSSFDGNNIMQLAGHIPELKDGIMIG